MKRVVVALLAVATFILRCVRVDDPDYHWHLHTGRFVARTYAVPRTDSFSHTMFGAPWKFVDWLADLFMWGVHRVGGDALVVMSFAAVGAVALALALHRAREVDRVTLLATGLLVLAVAQFRITPRPQTFTLLLVVVVSLLLDRVRSGARWWPVPLALVAWQNLHSSALLGVALVLVWTIGALLDGSISRGRGALLVVSSALAPLVAVRPLARIAAGFDHLGDPRVARLFAEWGHAFTVGAFGPWVIVFLLSLVLAAIGVSRARKALGSGAVATAFVLSLLGLLSLRFLPLAALVLAPLVAHGIEALVARVRHVALAFVVVGLVPLAMQAKRPGLGLAPGVFPERAAAFVEQHDLRGRLFNDFHFGGYLLFTLGEQRAPVFVDGRSMALYGIGFVEQAATATGPAFLALVDRHEVTLAIIPPDARTGALQRAPGWSLLFFDDTAAVLVRDAAATDATKALAYRAVTPTTWFEIEPLRADPARLARARVESERALREAPDSSVAAVLAVAVALAGDDLARADALLAEAVARFPEQQRVARARLLRALVAHDRDAACSVAREIQVRFPKNSYTAATVTQLRCP